MKENFENIYEHIGYLFYALVRGEVALSTAQLVKLTELIERMWKPMSNGNPELHLHLVDCIHAGVKYAVENRMSREHALSSFRTYFQIHGLPFGIELKKKVISSVLAIQKEFPSGRAKELFTELEDLLGIKPVEV